MVKAVHFSVNGVRSDVKRIDFDGVAMHVERVLLREVLHQCTLSGKTRALLLIINKVLAVQFVLVFTIDVDHISKTFAATSLLIVEEAVARDGLLLIDHRRTPVHLRLVGLCVEETVLRVNGTAILRHL